MWVFGPWKSRDWMQETEETALEDVDARRIVQRNVGRSAEDVGAASLLKSAAKPVTPATLFEIMLRWLGEPKAAQPSTAAAPQPL